MLDATVYYSIMGNKLLGRSEASTREEIHNSPVQKQMLLSNSSRTSIKCKWF